MIYKTQVNEGRHYDIIVCGGGMTGFSAAVIAARCGLKTAIIERWGCLGGVATSCGVNHLLGGRKYDEKTGKMVRKVGGLFDELTDRLISIGGAIDPDTIDIYNNPHGWYPRMAAGIPFDAEQLKILMDEMCAEENIDIYYFTSIIDVIAEDREIKSLVLYNKSGLFYLTANKFIDCTGDGDVAYKSGCAMVKGRDEDGLMTPATLIMHVDNVDREKYLKYQNTHQSPKLVEIINDLREKGIWKFPYNIFIAIQLNDPDVFMINTMRMIGIDGTKGSSLSEGIIQGRKESMQLFSIIKQYFPGFENARVRRIFDTIGIRETRRIIGKYTVTLEDALTGKKFDDCIACTTYNFDLPDPIKPSYDPMLGNAANPSVHREHDTIQIPYRSLIPTPISNLIAAGRCISLSREVLGAARVMGPCMMMGQAAGLAAVIAVNENKSFDEIDVSLLRKKLIETNVLLP